MQTHDPAEPADLADPADPQANGLMRRGLDQLAQGTPESLRAAIACFDAVIQQRRRLPLDGDPWTRYGLIAAWMNRGDVLTRLGETEDQHEAVLCYDEALRELRSLPVHEHPLFGRRLAIAWLNRGVTLLHSGTADCLRPSPTPAFAGAPSPGGRGGQFPPDRLERTQQAVGRSWLQPATPGNPRALKPPSCAEPEFPSPSGRGVRGEGNKTTSPTVGTTDAIAEALASFQEAIAAAQRVAETAPTEGLGPLAAAWMNRANALLRQTPPEPLAARTAALEALRAGASGERQDPELAEVGLQSRYLLCQAIACCLSSSAPLSSTPEDLLAAAADAVDDGLALARHWEAQGQPRLRTLAIGLFVFGCRVYAIHQPQFLNEFLAENLDLTQPASALARQDDAQSAALDAIWRRLAHLQRDGFRALGQPRFAEILRDLRDLRLTHERLAARAQAGALPDSLVAVRAKAETRSRSGKEEAGA